MEGKRLIRALWQRYPKKLSADFDFPGRQIGKLPAEVKKVLVCLDFDSLLLPEAEKLKPDLIITHHPFLFGTRAQVFKRDPVRAQTAQESENRLHLCIYSFHTCFDTARGGMNDLLAARLDLKDVSAPPSCPMMRIGELEKEEPLKEFAEEAMKKLGVSYSLLLPYGKKTVRRVAVIGGGGAGMYQEAIGAGADIYISGDMSHHVRREIIERNFNYLDVPHEAERIFIPGMAQALKEIDPSLEVTTADHEREAEACVSD